MSSPTPPLPFEIRRSQARALRKVFFEQVARDVLPDLQDLFPQQCQALGPKNTMAEIRRGLVRARGYDVEDPADFRRFLVLWFALGRNFDLDPTRPWIRGILEQRQKPASFRVRELFETTLEFLRHESARPGPGEVWA